MTDASTPKQAAEPNQDITASDQSQVYAPPNPGGSAQLDANIAAGESTHPQNEALADPIATNFSSGTGTGGDKTAGTARVAGSDLENQASQEDGTVHLHQDANPVESNPQGELPDTDPTSLPLNPDVNLPD